MRIVFLLSFLWLCLPAHSYALSWDDSCLPFTDGCLFVLATKELSSLESEDSRTRFYHLAFHAGRLGYTSIPGESLEMLPKKYLPVANRLLQIGRSVRNGETGINLNKPVVSAEQVLIAEYTLAHQLSDLGQEDIVSILAASEIPHSIQGRLLGRVLAENLNRGESRLADGRLSLFVDHLQKSEYSAMALGALAIELALNGYTIEARELVERELALDQHIFSQDVLLFIRAIQSALDDDVLRSVTLASAIQSQTFRLEALAQLFALTRDQFIGKQFLSSLYDFSQPLSSGERLNLVLFTMSSM